MNMHNITPTPYSHDTVSQVCDWFEPPSDTTTRTLHRALLLVGIETPLLSDLLAQRTQSYPGGSFTGTVAVNIFS